MDDSGLVSLQERHELRSRLQECESAALFNRRFNKDDTDSIYLYETVAMIGRILLRSLEKDEK
jgi:hypothetical protein